MVGQQLTRYWPTGFIHTDKETEGLNLAYTRPWQVAWGLFDVKGHPQWIKVRYVWWPDLKVSREAAVITRFNYDDYKAQAQPAAEVLAEYRRDINNPAYRIVWQNGLNLDYWAFRNWERSCGIERPDESYLLRSIDTNALLKAIAKGWKPDVSSPEAFLRWQYQSVNWIERGLKTNLTEVGKVRRIEHDYSSLHDAQSDICLMAKIFAEVVWEVDI